MRATLRLFAPCIALGVALGAVASTTPVGAQSVPGAPDHVVMGIAADQALDPETALRHYRAALAVDAASYEASWRAAMALINLGQQTPASVPSPQRDSMYAEAEAYARRAVLADSTKADGHFALAVALGYAALTKSKKERVRHATEIRDEALRAVAIDSTHDGAYHVLGRWNAEVMRLSGLSRFLAKTFLGGGVLGKASWQEAIDDLERAVRLAPTRLYHRLDLARVYFDRKRYDDARAQLRAIDSLPTLYSMDAVYKKDAAELLRRIAGK